MNRATIRSRAYKLMGVDPDNPVIWSIQTMNRYIEDAYQEFARETGCLEVRIQPTMVSGQAEYTMPDEVAQIERVTFDDYKLFPATQWQFDRLDEDWRELEGTVTHYLQDRLSERTIRLYKIPDSVATDGELDSELGVVIDANDSAPGDANAETYQFRFASLQVSLGTVVDVDVTGATVTFEAADDGGGVDEGYGIMVAFDEDSADVYQFGFADNGAASTGAKDRGVVVEVTQTVTSQYDDIIFLQKLAGGTNGESSADTEYGIVIDIDDEDGSQGYAFGTELGVLTAWHGSEERLEIWARKRPKPLSQNNFTPELPNHAHMALAYMAAARALRARTEGRNRELSKLYKSAGREYMKFVKRLANRRTPEKLDIVGRRPPARRPHRFRDTTIPTS